MVKLKKYTLTNINHFVAYKNRFKYAKEFFKKYSKNIICINLLYRYNIMHLFHNMHILLQTIAKTVLLSNK